MTPQLIVEKANGDKLHFIPQKIINAIMAANKDDLTFEQINEIVKSIQDSIPNSTTTIHVNDLHEIVNQALARHGYTKTAMNYRSYRLFRKNLNKELTDISLEITKYPKEFPKELIKKIEKTIETKKTHIKNKYPDGLPEKILNYALIQELIHDQDFMTLNYFIYH